MSMTSINWYPGHMKKTKDLIKENLKLIDVVLEIVDARIPLSSRNPDISNMSKKANKKRILLLNKTDLVDKSEIKKWRDFFINNGSADEVLEISAETGYNIKKIYSLIEKLSKEKKEKLLAKGLRKVSIRILVAGIPNVGKSRLINTMVGKKATGVGNKPGFTKGKQWVRIMEGIELLDTPGILWPKFESEEVGLALAIAGAIKEEILPTEEVACNFIEVLKKIGKIDVLTKYKLNEEDFNKSSNDILESIAKNQNMLLKAGKLNMEQAANTLLRDYRAARLGKFSIDIF